MESISIGKFENMGISNLFHWQVEPREFSILKSGGQENDFKVQGIISVAGRQWSTSKNFINKSFNQKL